MSEWEISGLHPAPCSVVKAPRVKEAIFASECRLDEVKEFESKATPGKKSGVLAIVEGVNFWARDDSVNEDLNLIDPEVYMKYFLVFLFIVGVAWLISSLPLNPFQVLRPVGRFGGIMYNRNAVGFEALRPQYESWLDREKKP